MKKVLIIYSLTTFLAACAVTPPPQLTSEETTRFVVQHKIIKSCYAMGQLPNHQATAAYLNALETALSSQGSPSLINSAQRQAAALPPPNSQICQQASLLILQFSQQQAQLAQQAATQSANRQAVRTFNNEMQNMQRNTAQQQPRNVTCQYYQWGNMTSCSSF